MTDPSIEGAVRENLVTARPMLRETFGDIRLVSEQGTVYAEFEDVADLLMLSVGGASMDRVAGEGFEPSTFGL